MRPRNDRAAVAHLEIAQGSALRICVPEPFAPRGQPELARGFHPSAMLRPIDGIAIRLQGCDRHPTATETLGNSGFERFSRIQPEPRRGFSAAHPFQHR
jgi:hypothetical protein